MCSSAKEKKVSRSDPNISVNTDVRERAFARRRGVFQRFASICISPLAGAGYLKR